MNVSGVDMLIKNILSAAGIDPVKVTSEIQEYGKQLAAKIESMDKSLRDLKTQQDAMYEILLSLALKDRKPAADLAADLAAIAAPPNGGVARG